MKRCMHARTNTFKGEVIRATNCCNLQRNIVALQVEKRRCTYYHPPQTLSRDKILLLHVEVACCSKLCWRLLFSTRFFYLQQQNFVAWQCLRWVGNTANNAFQLATWQCCVLSCSNLLLVLLNLKVDWYFSFTIQIDNSDEAYELLREWKRERYVLRWMLKKLFGLRTNYVFFQ